MEHGCVETRVVHQRTLYVGRPVDFGLWAVPKNPALDGGQRLDKFLFSHQLLASCGINVMFNHKLSGSCGIKVVMNNRKASASLFATDYLFL